MKKYVFLLDALNLLNKVVNEGRRVEGVLFRDESTGNLTFKPYHRRGLYKMPDRLIARLEHGWVKESTERIKVYESIPKVIGTTRVMTVLEREGKEVKNALIDRELIEFM